MKKNLLTGLAITAALAATTATGSVASAASAADKAPSGVVSGGARLTAAARALDADTDKALAKYWTPERMKSAKSLDQLTIKGTPPRAGTDRVKLGTPGAVAPSGTSADRTDLYRAPGNYPAWGPNQATAKTNGKVFFTGGNDGLSYVCSASVVNSEGKSLVWTAGHCVTWAQTWHYNWVFVPAYKNGLSPKGIWTANQPWSLSAWFYNNSDFANDVGAVIMNRRNGGRIAETLGAQGIKWNFARTRVVALGYPHASPFNGQRLYRENGMTYAYGTDSYMTNYMTGGSSGGPWLREFNGQYGYVNGHNDYKYTAWPQYMFSPFYGNQVATLYGAVRGLTT